MSLCVCAFPARRNWSQTFPAAVPGMLREIFSCSNEAAGISVTQERDEASDNCGTRVMQTASSRSVPALGGSGAVCSCRNSTPGPAGGSWGHQDSGHLPSRALQLSPCHGSARGVPPAAAAAARSWIYSRADISFQTASTPSVSFAFGQLQISLTSCSEPLPKRATRAQSCSQIRPWRVKQDLVQPRHPQGSGDWAPGKPAKNTVWFCKK